MADGSQEQTQRTALYRHFDNKGRLLYVGISLSPTYRFAQHRDSSRWFERITDVKIEWYPTREEALKAECHAIKTEDPEFNIIHKVTPHEAHMMELAEDSSFELTRKVSRYGSVYSPRLAADACGVSPVAMKMAMAAGEIPYFISGNKLVITGWAVVSYLEALQAGHVKVRRRAVMDDGRYEPGPSTEELVAKLK